MQKKYRLKILNISWSVGRRWIWSLHNLIYTILENKRIWRLWKAFFQLLKDQSFFWRHVYDNLWFIFTIVIVYLGVNFYCFISPRVKIEIPEQLFTSVQGSRIVIQISLNKVTKLFKRFSYSKDYFCTFILHPRSPSL